jgi:hypothetical protein
MPPYFIPRRPHKCQCRYAQGLVLEHSTIHVLSSPIITEIVATFLTGQSVAELLSGANDSTN